MGITVVVDADAIVAHAHATDSNHSRALTIARRLGEKEIRLVYPVTAIIEAVTVLQRS